MRAANRGGEETKGKRSSAGGGESARAPAVENVLQAAALREDPAHTGMTCSLLNGSYHVLEDQGSECGGRRGEERVGGGTGAGSTVGWSDSSVTLQLQSVLIPGAECVS